MSSHLDKTLIESLGSHLDNFFTSLQGDSNSLTSFLGTLTAIDATVRAHRDRLHIDTLAAVHNFTTVVNGVASSILDLEKSGDKMGMELMSDVSKILNTKMDDLRIDDKEHDAYVSGRQPLYVKSAYEWLLSHLHNPYPSKEFKKRLSQETNFSVKDIDLWFMDARKRIGWNKLRKDRFSNKQDKIIAAAMLFFNPPTLYFSGQDEDSRCVLDPVEDYSSDFALMKQKATELFSNSFPNVSRLEHFEDRSKPLHQDNNKSRKFLYPTPEPPSPSASETHLPLDSSPQRTSRSMLLERRSTISPSNKTVTRDCSHQDLPNSHASSLAMAVASLPSPTPTIIDHEDLDHESTSNNHNSTDSFTTSQCRRSSDKSMRKRKRDSSNEESQPPRHRIRITGPVEEDVSPQPILTTVASSSTSTSAQDVRPMKRKRRLSDAGIEAPRKRPHNALCVPRLQAVSDPFPLPRETEDIFDFFKDLQGDEYEYHLSDTISLPIVSHDFEPQEAVEVQYHDYQYPLCNPTTNFPAFQSYADCSSLTGLSLETDSGDDQHINLIVPREFSENFFNLLPPVDSDFDILSTYQLRDTIPSNFVLDAPFVNNLDLPSSYAEQEAKRAHVKRLREEIRILEEQLNIP